MHNSLRWIRRCFSLAASTHGRRTVVAASEGGTDKGCNIENHLKRLQHPTARLLAEQLANKNPYIRTVAYSPLQDAINRAKLQHPHHIIAIWNGSCYEVHGIDAAMCVEYCGLQPTGLTPHVEIPDDRLASVIDDLKRQEIQVAIYKYVSSLETVTDDESAILKRSLVFSHEASENDDQPSGLTTLSGRRDDRVVVGVTHNRKGYSVSIIHPTKCMMEIRERLNLPAAMSLLQSVDSRVVIFQNGNSHVKKLLSYLPTVIHYEPIQVRNLICRHFKRQQGRIDAENFHKAACANIKMRLNIRNKFKVNKLQTMRTEMDALDRETAASLGLISNNVDGTTKLKTLHLQMLPDDAPPYMKQYMVYLFTRIIPEDVTNDIRYVCSKLVQLPVALLDVKPVSASKLRALISQQKIDASHLMEIYNTIKAFTYYTEAIAPALTKKIYSVALSDLNIDFKMDESKRDAHKCCTIVKSSVVCDVDIPTTGITCIDNLFKRWETEASRVNRNLLIRERGQVDAAVVELLEAISLDYLGISLSTIDNNVKSDDARLRVSSAIHKNVEMNREWNNIIDMNEHFIVLRSITPPIDHTKLRTVETVISTERVMCYYSDNVMKALINYRNKCSLAEDKASRMLIPVGKSLAKYAQSIVLMSHFVVVVQTLAAHVGMAVAKGWTMPKITRDREIVLKGLMPQQVHPDDVVPISVLMKGVHILPGQNNSGRSTCITTVLGACVAANIGLYIPCSNGSRVPKFTSFSYHSPSGRSHTEALCPSEYTMSTIEHIIDGANKDSLVMIDNLGSNLDVTQGTAFVAYVVNQLMRKGTMAIIATNVSNLREQHLRGANFNMLVTRNGAKELIEAATKPPLLSDLFPNNEFVKRAQAYINRYYLDGTAGIEVQTTDTRMGVAMPPEPSDDAQEDKYKETCCASVIDNIPPHLRESARVVIKVIEELSFCVVKNDVVHIFENGMPPPMLNNVPALYIALVPIITPVSGNVDSVGSNEDDYENERATAVYVGETGNLTGRLKSHRAKSQYTVDEYFGKTYMNHESELTEYLQTKNQLNTKNVAGYLGWHAAHALAIKMNSRMDARIYERKVIKRLYNYQNEIILLSHRDGVYREIAPID